MLNTARQHASNYLKLHRADCGTISGTPARGTTWTKYYMKICADDRAELGRFARQVGGLLDPCRLCNP